MALSLAAAASVEAQSHCKRLNPMQDERSASTKSHWSRQQERGVYWGLWFSLQCYRWLGPQVLRWLLYPIIGYFYLTHGAARRHSLGFLQRVHAQGGFAHAPRQRDVFRHFLNFGDSLIDRLASWRGEIRHEHVDFAGHEALIAQTQTGVGALVISSHLGNTEICRALNDQFARVRINALVYQAHAPQINRLIRATNPDADLTLIDVRNFGPQTGVLLDGLIRRGECVAIAADRTPPGATRHVTQAQFLGAPAEFPAGPFVLASLLRCPVFLLHCVKVDGIYQVRIQPFADQIRLGRKQRDADLALWTQRYADALAQQVLQTPLQWYNFFDFWEQSAP